MTMTIRVHSTPLIYSPGIFSYIEQAVIPFDEPKARELIAALGIPCEYIDKIINGEYEKTVNEEILVLTV